MPIRAIVPAGARLQKQKTGQNHRPFLPDEGWGREAGADAAGAEGAEYAGRESIGCIRGVADIGGGENEGLGCGAGAGAGALQRLSAGA